MIQIIVKYSFKRYTTTYKFNNAEAARLFINKFNLESKIVDIL